MESYLVLAVIGVWIFEGFALKYLDQVVDDGRSINRSALTVLIVLAGLAAGFIMSFDLYSLSAVTSLILGVIVSKKIDDKLWVFQIILVAAFLALFFPFTFIVLFDFKFDWITLIIIFVFVAVGSLLDEVTHELVDKKLGGHPRLQRVLLHRLIMKVLIVVMAVLIPAVAWFHAVAWICFDVTYDLTGLQYKHETATRSVEQPSGKLIEGPSKPVQGPLQRDFKHQRDLVNG